MKNQGLPPFVVLRLRGPLTFALRLALRFSLVKIVAPTGQVIEGDIMIPVVKSATNLSPWVRGDAKV